VRTLDPRLIRPARATRGSLGAVAATGTRSAVLTTRRMAHTGACDEVIVLRDGRVAQRGAPASLAGRYAEALARERGESIHA
jgi:ABC-type multidrug transport system ATPase subunit